MVDNIVHLSHREDGTQKYYKSNTERLVVVSTKLYLWSDEVWSCTGLCRCGQKQS